MTSQTAVHTSVAAITTTGNRTAALSAMLIGTALIFLVGFAPLSAVHNAAHDTRHSAAFPCH
jgi:cobalt transporter subunit CbtB